MPTFLGVRWDEIFILSMIVFTVGAPVVYLVYLYRKHTMDDPDCSKYSMFQTDPDIRPDEEPQMPTSCQPAYLSRRPWWNSVNTSWLFFTLGVAVIWVAIMLGAFFASRSVESMRMAYPM